MTLNETRTTDAIARLNGGLVVSCQAPEGSPMADPYVTSRVALSAIMGGAAGLRINGIADIEAVRGVTDATMIGLFKVKGANRLEITPTLEHARSIVAAGASIVALDASHEVHGTDLSLIRQVKQSLGVPVMADVSTFEEGMRAWESGADLVGTTLSGYTPETLPTPSTPDFELVSDLAEQGIQVVAEGRLNCADQVTKAFDHGAYFVVVGGAITDPLKTTSSFAEASRLGRARLMV